MKSCLAVRARRRSGLRRCGDFRCVTSAAFRRRRSSGVQQQAAPIQSIAAGQTKSGSFAGQSANAETVPYHEYRLSLSQGQSVVIRLNSPDPVAVPTPIPPATAPEGFDTYLELRAEGEALSSMTDDDGGAGLNSRIAFVAPSAGNYIIRARPLSAVGQDQSPTYSLLVEGRQPPPPPTEFTFPSEAGDLGPGSAEEESYEPVRYAAYWFQGRATERIQFDMTSSGPSPSLQIIDANGTVLGSNISYDDNNVRLIAATPVSGRYLVRAQIPSDQAAHYSVTATRHAAPSPRPQPTRSARRSSGVHAS